MKIEPKKENWQLKQIYFYLTDKCNLSCQHCWLKANNRDRNGGFLDSALIKDILRQAKPLGLTHVKLTGGEPLLHPDFPEMVEYIRHQRTKLVVETNGILITEEIASLLSNSSDTSVAVSLDGIDSGTHDAMRGVRGSFEKTLQGIKNLVSKGNSPQIIFSIVNKNLHQIDGIIDLAIQIGAASVKFNIVQPSGKGAILFDKGRLPTVTELIATGRYVEGTLAEKVKIPLIYDYPPAFRKIDELVKTNNRGGCQTCGIQATIGVLPQGEYAICGVGKFAPELRLGNCWQELLETVWKDSPLINSIRHEIPQKLEGICKNCIMKNLCIGKCIAQNWVTTGSLWGANWFCQSAEKEGCFPVSRRIDM